VKNEMDGTCSAYVREDRRIQGLVGKPVEDPGVDGRIILRWIFRKSDVGVWTGSSWFRIGAGGGTL
jgi:hypothetical protein